jgi:hypothetical protein
MAVGIACLVMGMWLYFADWSWRRNAEKTRSPHLNEEHPASYAVRASYSHRRKLAASAPVARALAIALTVLGILFILSGIH